MRGLAIFHLDDRACRELGAVLEGFPSGERRHPEDICLKVIIAIFEFLADGLLVFLLAVPAVIIGIEVMVACRAAKCGFDFSLPDCERVGDIFQEDKAEDGVLINGCVEIGAESVGGVPELFVGSRRNCWADESGMSFNRFEIGLDFWGNQFMGEIDECMRQKRIFQP